MLSMNIGKIKKVPLREIWKNEAYNFTSWLSENLDTLSEVLEINLALTQKEKEVGTFSLDILAEGENGEIVIIENQLEKTDHDHLGKLITYLSNLDAGIAIWIAAQPRDEHKKAIDWLNENSPDNIGFYLVKVEAIRISNSDAAPLFTIVGEPTEIAKSVGKEKRELAERHYKRKEFWTGLLEKARQKTKLYANISPKYDHWISAGIGKGGMGLNMAITKSRGQVEIYLDKGEGSQELNKLRFDELAVYKDDIEKVFGHTLDWERLDKNRASRIAYRYDGFGLENPEHWEELQNMMVDGIIQLHEAIKPYIAKLP
jgi:hypothetical protein